MGELFIGLSAGFLGAWLYFKMAGLLRTPGEFYLARHLTDAEVSEATMRQARLLEPSDD